MEVTHAILLHSQLPYAGDWVGCGGGVGDILPTLIWSMKSKVKDLRKLV